MADGIATKKFDFLVIPNLDQGPDNFKNTSPRSFFPSQDLASVKQAFVFINVWIEFN